MSSNKGWGTKPEDGRSRFKKRRGVLQRAGEGRRINPEGATMVVCWGDGRVFAGVVALDDVLWSH
jgi:hypothetical protein